MIKPFLSTEESSIVFHPRHMDDAMLWRAFKNDDESALITIFDRFAKPLYNYGCKIMNEPELVQDTIQDLFIELWKNRKHLGETNAIKPYLYKSLRRKLIRIKLKAGKSLLVRFLPEYDQVGPSPEFKLIAEQECEEQRNKIFSLFEQHLTKRQREALFLRFFEELEYDRIATIMNLNRQVVYNLIHKAIGQLRSALTSNRIF